MIEQRNENTVFCLSTTPGFGCQLGEVGFAACISGLCVSHDGGQHWLAAYDSLGLDQPLETMTVAISPAYRSDRTVFSGVDGGVLRSIDGGKTWNSSVLASPPPLVTCLAISPNSAEDGIVLAGTMEDGIFRSTDQGRHWTPANFGLLDLHVLAMATAPSFERGEMVFAGTESGSFRSQNGGRAWREVNLPGGNWRNINPSNETALPLVYLVSGAMREDEFLVVGNTQARTVGNRHTAIRVYRV